LVATIIYAFFITRHAYRWARVIIILENEYSDALEVHKRTLKTFENLLNMQMFFDSPTVKQTVIEVMEDVKLCQGATARIASVLTSHSKRKYVDEEREEGE
jgi:alpha-L-fucosidase